MKCYKCEIPVYDNCPRYGRKQVPLCKYCGDRFSEPGVPGVPGVPGAPGETGKLTDEGPKRKKEGWTGIDNDTENVLIAGTIGVITGGILF